MASNGIYSQYTFGQLASVPATLGSTGRRGKTPDLNTPYRAYENTEYDAWTMLPDLADGEQVEHAYVRRVERMLEDRGVADEVTLHELLREAAQRQTQAA